MFTVVVSDQAGKNVTMFQFAATDGSSSHHITRFLPWAATGPPGNQDRAAGPVRPISNTASGRRAAMVHPLGPARAEEPEAAV